MPLALATDPFTQQAARTLKQREAELRAMLLADAAAAIEAASEVLDFKDVAAAETRAVVDEVARAHAAGELARVVAALRRVDDGSYGLCVDCGEPIDHRRLLALPATPFCTACQAIHERPAPTRR